MRATLLAEAGAVEGWEMKLSQPTSRARLSPSARAGARERHTHASASSSISVLRFNGHAPFPADVM